MKFALFYEIPVPRPWGEDSELVAYQNTLEQAIAGDRHGWHAFWTVEHHFLQEYSHCSNPEVLYGAIAARTENIRLGYGVRLMPKPYNHPVRTAESVAVLDLLSKGRVDMGAGRSATRTELEGFGIDPAVTRQMWQEALGHIVGCWTNEEYEFEGEYWQMPRRRVQPKPWQKPHPPLWGATTSDEGHAQVGDLGLGLCSFAVGLPPSEVKRKIDVYRAAVEKCTQPVGAFVHNQAATFTMALCGPDSEKAKAAARESFEWYPKTGAAPDRHAHGLDGGAQAGTGQLLLRRRHEEDGRRGHARPPQSRVPGGCQRVCPRDTRRVPGGLPRLRGRRGRPPAVPGQPVQDLPRVRHADDRAHGHRGHPALRRLKRTRAIRQSGGMGRDAGRRLCHPAVAAAAIATALSALAPIAWGAGPAAAARKGTTLAKAPALAQTGHAAFWSCPAKTTELLVVVNTLTLHPGAPLRVSFTVRNSGTASCNYTAPYAGAAPGPTSTVLTAGPCGSVGFEIENAQRHDVWPGDEVVNCPALGFAQLAPGATVSGTGSWDQTKPNSTRRVTPGTYRLVITRTPFSFPLHIDKS